MKAILVKDWQGGYQLELNGSYVPHNGAPLDLTADELIKVSSAVINLTSLSDRLTILFDTSRGDYEDKQAAAQAAKQEAPAP